MIPNLKQNVLSILTLIIGSIALIGWISSIDVFKSILPGLATMKVNTALGFITASGALLVYNMPHRRGIGMTLAVFTLMIGLVSALEYVLNMNFGIDELFIPDPDTPASQFPGRMSAGTAFNFVLIGVGLVMLYRPKWRLYSPYPALIANALATIALLGYFYDVNALYDIALFSSMALNTSVAFLLVGSALLFATPDNIIVRVLTASTVGGTSARRVIPFAILIPVMLGWLTIEGEELGILTGFVGQSILSTGIVLLLVCVVWWNAYILHTTRLKQQQIEASLAQSERRFRTLFEKSPDINFIVDQNTHHIIEVNDTIHTTLGYQPHEIIGRKFTEVAGEGIGRKVLGNLNDEEVNYFNQTVECATQDECPVDLTVKIIPWDHTHAVLVTMRDIAERIRLEDTLSEEREKRIELETEKEVILLKEEFMAMMSHDFRTPLSVILTSNGLLLQYRDRLTEERKIEHLQRINRQVKFMMELIDDVMTFIEAQTGKVAFAPYETNVVQLCQDVLEGVYTIASEEHTIVFDTADNIGMQLIDPKLVRRILHNLLSNAVKYSPNGGEVRFSVYMDANTLVMIISDQGIGIPKAAQAKLFQAFRRASNVGDIKGSGLGLAIVKQSVDIHGGDIGVTSVENAGTTFTLRLPVNPR